MARGEGSQRPRLERTEAITWAQTAKDRDQLRPGSAAGSSPPLSTTLDCDEPKASLDNANMGVYATEPINIYVWGLCNDEAPDRPR